MKKIISIFLTLIILTLSLSFFCFAEDAVTLSLNNEKVYAGDEFTINLFISDNSQMSGAVIDINYDNEKLEFVSAKEGAILDPKANISIRNINNEKSYVRFTYMAASSSVISDGILLSISFKALESAKGETELSITIPNPADFVTSDLEKIPYKVNNAKITVLNDIPTETTTEQEESQTEISTESTTEPIFELVENNDIETNENKNINDKVLTIVLLLVGISLVCFGIVVAIKKKK